MIHVVDDPTFDNIGDAIYFSETVEKAKSEIKLDGYSDKNIVGVFELNLIEGKEALPNSII